MTTPRRLSRLHAARGLFAATSLLFGLTGMTNLARSAGDTELVSVGPTGQAGGVYDASGLVSANGRYVVLLGSPTGLVPGNHVRQQDVFVRDRQSDMTDWIDVTPSGAQSNSSAFHSAISGDGRYVAFASNASDLIPGDTNGHDDIFVRDRQSGITERVSLASSGAQANSDSDNLAMSANGRYVAFTSDASNLVPGDTNAQWDIFVHDRNTGTTERVSVSSAGTQANDSSFRVAISGDGRYVAFESMASNLVAGGRPIPDLFVRDRQTGVTSRISVNSQGIAANDGSYAPSISADGRFVAFESPASNLVAGDSNSHDDVFVHDRQSGKTERISIAWNGVQANDGSFRCAISADGRRVAFVSFASNLVIRDTNRDADVFVRDRISGTTERASVDSAGAQANDRSLESQISADGRFVTLSSFATNLASNDSNALEDVYIHELAAPTPPRTSALTVSPRQLDFGQQPANSTSDPKTFIVTNTSSAAVAITGVKIRGNNPGQFAHTHDCGDSLAAGTHCSVKVVFAPNSLGARSAYLLVNGGGNGLRAVYLTGIGFDTTP